VPFQRRLSGAQGFQKEPVRLDKVFEAFSAENRVHVSFADLPLDLLRLLLCTKDQFLEAKNGPYE
jgi:hypothetical protein